MGSTSRSWNLRNQDEMWRLGSSWGETSGEQNIMDWLSLRGVFTVRRATIPVYWLRIQQQKSSGIYALMDVGLACGGAWCALPMGNCTRHHLTMHEFSS